MCKLFSSKYEYKISSDFIISYDYKSYSCMRF